MNLLSTLITGFAFISVLFSVKCTNFYHNYEWPRYWPPPRHFYCGLQHHPLAEPNPNISLEPLGTTSTPYKNASETPGLPSSASETTPTSSPEMGIQLTTTSKVSFKSASPTLVRPQGTTYSPPSTTANTQDLQPQILEGHRTLDIYAKKSAQGFSAPRQLDHTTPTQELQESHTSKQKLPLFLLPLPTATLPSTINVKELPYLSSKTPETTTQHIQENLSPATASPPSIEIEHTMSTRPTLVKLPEITPLIMPLNKPTTLAKTLIVPEETEDTTPTSMASPLSPLRLSDTNSSATSSNSSFETTTQSSTQSTSTKSTRRIFDRSTMRLSEQKCFDWYANKTVNAALPYVVGGKRAYPGEFPYMCAIGWNSSNTGALNNTVYLCGCALIAENYVLTAAHCTSRGVDPPSVVRVGGIDLNKQDAEIIRVTKIIQHPDYNGDLAENDIAIIQMDNNSNTLPACLWNSNAPPRKYLEALGYGQTKFGGPTSNFLLKVLLKIVSHNNCSEFYGEDDKLPNGLGPGHVCAGDPEAKMDTCTGDSGGPLLFTLDKYRKTIYVPIIVGVTSFGDGCAFGTPSVYTNIFHYLEWIENSIWKL